MTERSFIKVFIGLAIAFFFQLACKHAENEKKGEIAIVDFRQSKEPEDNLGSHKPYDVEVFRILFIMGNSYHVKYYQKEGDTLRIHSAYYGDSLDFDKASYHWVNDTSVSIRLYNSATKKEKTFKVFGHRNISGMSVD